MKKKDYLTWMLSDTFDMEKLRSLFIKVLPFKDNDASARNRLIYLVMKNAENNIVGRHGLLSIRESMSMNELLVNVLLQGRTKLIRGDKDYYLDTNDTSAPFVGRIIMHLYLGDAFISWEIINNQLVTLISADGIIQELIHTDLHINNDGYYEIK